MPRPDTLLRLLNHKFSTFRFGIMRVFIFVVSAEFYSFIKLKTFYKLNTLVKSKVQESFTKHNKRNAGLYSSYLYITVAIYR